MNKRLTLILLLGLLLRLAFVLSVDPMQAYENDGGDQLWYLANGYGFFSPEIYGNAHGITYTMDAIGNAPLYMIFVGLPQHLFSPELAILVIRVLQALMGTVTVYFAYRLAYQLAGENAGLIAAAVLAIAPVLLFEPRYMLSETAYIFFIMAGLWLYADFMQDAEVRWWMVLLVGAVFGLATLTRAVGILYPVGLVGLIVLSNLKHWRRGLLLATALLLSYSAIVGTWTAHNWLNYGRFIIGSNQLMPSIWRGAVSPTGSPAENDALLAGSSASEQVAETVSSDPTGYLSTRVKELAGSYLQPHGTIPLGGESLKEMASAWLQSGFSLDGFLRLINGEGFWMKLLLYIWHYVALMMGLIGMWLSHRQWRISLALIGFIVYTTLLHLVVLALPRYIFPTYPLFWIFAAVTLARLWSWVHERRVA